MKTIADAPLADFAAHVMNLASASPARWGRTKVWISDLGRSEAFRARLVEAHRAGLVHLTRCDLTTALSAEERAKCARSEVGHMNAQWHLMDVAAR